MKIKIRPATLKQANEMIEALHRHHKRVVGHRFSIACIDGEKIHGIAVIGRPVARELDAYYTAEVTRLVTDGTKNACSMLYGAAARIAKEMGFDFIQTYILESEPGTSLKASGWICEGIVRKDGKGWNNRNGRRTDQPVISKVRWRKYFNNQGDKPDE